MSEVLFFLVNLNNGGFFTQEKKKEEKKKKKKRILPVKCFKRRRKVFFIGAPPSAWQWSGWPLRGRFSLESWAPFFFLLFPFFFFFSFLGREEMRNGPWSFVTGSLMRFTSWLAVSPTGVSVSVYASTPW